MLSYSITTSCEDPDLQRHTFATSNKLREGNVLFTVERGYHVTITTDALDLTTQESPLPSPKPSCTNLLSQTL